MIAEHEWPSLASDFADDGQYRYIEVENATLADWQSVLDLLRLQGEVISFEVEGVAKAAPRDASLIIEWLATSAVTAQVKIAGVTYDWCIWVPTLLSFSLHPTIRNAVEFAGMCRFIELLNLATAKSVEVNLEGVSTIARFIGRDEGFVWFVGGGASTH
ncbi:hypothetical protein EIB18_05865 [Caulobacter vibrioides]|uniref:Uncharacterized protein n=2 Tax=Caulobacter vibrioides TaxID=155892 RepID=Q9A9A6_CAUVC|nr:hypothetical protein [Caulobacter vibrioides]YP_002516515.1 hypothetical protein CCNA_01142 [Caulobacter vibrioides NA1000]AAK23072.1 hypothetical protein CC_1088 [Caulobacter vibrioides CB15]ACL94607.1 hypothetical protein CCNA_01142 [Caulobacter vibrioides NA1000]ATC24033.1 hypothetical protein CA608_05600 [Caulobacter vibrioides]ATC27916.1 hypothetical protein CA607_05795 [Caulobacter vibrioides]AZH12279.1 hypothetical protein EIB18_05865 [Caulobacter vibrioides]